MYTRTRTRDSHEHDNCERVNYEHDAAPTLGSREKGVSGRWRNVRAFCAFTATFVVEHRLSTYQECGKGQFRRCYGRLITRWHYVYKGIRTCAYRCDGICVCNQQNDCHCLYSLLRNISIHIHESSHVPFETSRCTNERSHQLDMLNISNNVRSNF